jgi:hypothetical protein
MDKIVLHKGFNKGNVALTFWTENSRNWNGTTIELTAADILTLQAVLARGEILDKSSPQG